jgi:hypothetical protein
MLKRRGDSFSMLTGIYVFLYLVIFVKTLELFLLYLMAHFGMVVKGKLKR